MFPFPRAPQETSDMWHILLQNKFQVSKAVVMKIGVSWDVVECASLRSRGNIISLL
jgi:hypothetical protein